jgi:hypothetical protein
MTIKYLYPVRISQTDILLIFLFLGVTHNLTIFSGLFSHGIFFYRLQIIIFILVGLIPPKNKVIGLNFSYSFFPFIGASIAYKRILGSLVFTSNAQLHVCVQLKTLAFYVLFADICLICTYVRNCIYVCNFKSILHYMQFFASSTSMIFFSCMR